MAERPVLRSQNVTRDKLNRAFNNDPVMVRAFENITSDVTGALPDAAMENTEATEKAQLAAEAAKTAADEATGAATEAQDAVQSLKERSYLVAVEESDLPNARMLEVDPLAFTLTDGGPANAIQIGSTEQIAVLATDISEAGAIFATGGLSFDLEALTTYVIEGVVVFQSAATTTGIALALSIPAGSSISGGFSHNVTSLSIEGSYSVADSTSKGATSGAPAVGENVPVQCRWVVRASEGVASLIFRSGVDTSAVTLKAGLTYLAARKIAQQA